MSDAAPDSKEGEAPAKVERKIINTSRLDRAKSYKPTRKPTPMPIPEPTPLEPEKVLNPDINESDARLCISIRLETRDAIIYERNEQRDGYKLVITDGSTSEAAIISLCEKLEEVSAGVKNSYQAYFMKKRPPETEQEKSERPIAALTNGNNNTDIVSEFENG